MNSTEKKSSVAKNYVYNLIYQLLTIITPLITTPYIARILGAKNNGIYGYTMSIVTYFILFGSLGVAMYGQREIAYVQDDKKKQTNIFWEVNIIKLVSYSISMIVFYLLFCIDGQYSAYYKILLIEMVANLIDISWFFQGNEDFKKTVLRNLIVKSIGLVCVFLFVKSRNDLWIYFLIFVLADLIGNLSLWLYLPKCLDKRKNKVKLKKHLKSIILLFLPQIAIQIYAVVDKTMIGKLTNNLSEVGYYDQAQKIVRALLLVVGALSSVMCSRIANAYSRNKNEEIRKYMLQSINMVFLIAIPAIFGIFALSDALVPIYFGPGYDKVIPILNLTSIILIVIGLNNVTGMQYLIQVKKQNVFTFSVVVGAIVNVILNIVFINMFGTIGAVYASVAAETIILLIQLHYTNDYIRLKDILTSLTKYLISGLSMFLLVRFLFLKLKPNLYSFLIELIVGAISYIAILLILKSQFIIDLINQVISYFKGRRKNV